MEDLTDFLSAPTTQFKVSLKLKDLSFRFTKSSSVFIEMNCNGVFARTLPEVVKTSRDSVKLMGSSELNFPVSWNERTKQYEPAILDLSLMQQSSDQVSLVGKTSFSLSTMINSKFLSSTVSLKLEKCSQRNCFLLISLSISKVGEEKKKVLSGLISPQIKSRLQAKSPTCNSRSRNFVSPDRVQNENVLDITAEQFPLGLRRMDGKEVARITQPFFSPSYRRNIKSFSRHNTLVSPGYSRSGRYIKDQNKTTIIASDVLMLSSAHSPEPRTSNKLCRKRTTLPALCIQKKEEFPSSPDLVSKTTLSNNLATMVSGNKNLNNPMVTSIYSILITPKKSSRKFLKCQEKSVNYFVKKSSSKANSPEQRCVTPLGNSFKHLSVRRSRSLIYFDQVPSSPSPKELLIDNVFSIVQLSRKDSTSITSKQRKFSGVVCDLKKKEKEAEFFQSRIQFLKEENDELRDQTKLKELSLISSEVQRRRLAQECEDLKKQIIEVKESVITKTNKMNMVVNTVFDMHDETKKRELFDKIERILSGKEVLRVT